MGLGCGINVHARFPGIGWKDNSPLIAVDTGGPPRLALYLMLSPSSESLMTT